MPMGPNYDVSGVHVDAVLSNISVAYFQNPANYIADKVFPIVNVAKKRDLYWKFDKADLLRDEAAVRAPGSLAVEVNAKLSSDSYETKTYGAKRIIPDEVLANYDTPLDPLRNAAQVVAQKLRTRMETQFVADFLGTGKWGTDLTGVASGPTGNQFINWDLAASNPLDDVEGAKTIIAASGYEANTLVIGRKVWAVLKRHPDVIDMVKWAGNALGTTEQMTQQAIASLLGIDQVLVARSFVNTAEEGATDAITDTVSDVALLCYTTSTPAIETATAGYIFQWSGISDGLGANIATRQYRIEERRSTAVESDIAFANKIVASDLGVFFTNVLSY